MISIRPKIVYCISLYSNMVNRSDLCAERGTEPLFLSASVSVAPKVVFCSFLERINCLNSFCNEGNYKPILLHNKIKRAMRIVFNALGGKINEWIVIKKEILKLLPPNLRACFGKRHPITKKQLLNETDLIVIDYWEQQTNKKLKLNLHIEETYTYRGRGFGLKEWHKTKKTLLKTMV